MEKRITALLFAVLLIVGTFVACGQRSKYGRVYVDVIGETYILATDKNGETVRSKEGDLYEVEMEMRDPTDREGAPRLDEDGNYVTKPFKFPKYIRIKEPRFRFFPIIFKKEYLQNKALKLPIFKGFEQSDTSNFHLSNEELGCYISCSVDRYTYEEISSYGEKIKEFIKESGADMEVSEDNITLCGENTYRCIITNNEDKNILTTYFFEKNNMIIRFQTQLNMESVGKIDLEALINTAVF
ncbi:MAG: hypothetical protein GX824_07680 [Clostridiales bacterium]|jgi:hypothetical protein|nr:hypothetical protein [Clostridiales bacterium]